MSGNALHALLVPVRVRVHVRVFLRALRQPAGLLNGQDDALQALEAVPQRRRERDSRDLGGLGHARAFQEGRKRTGDYARRSRDAAQRHMHPRAAQLCDDGERAPRLVG